MPERIVSIKDPIIRKIEDFEPFLHLMLLADLSETLVRNYVAAGDVVGATIAGKPVGVYVLTDNGDGVMELKNIAIAIQLQGQGLGKILIRHALAHAEGLGASRVEVGTGNSSLEQLRFYQSVGFERLRVDKGFFLRNYADPIYENGMQCMDMIILSKGI